MTTDLKKSDYVAIYKCRMCDAKFVQEIHTFENLPEVSSLASSICSMTYVAMNRAQINAVQVSEKFGAFIQPTVMHDCHSVFASSHFGVGDLLGISNNEIWKDRDGNSGVS